MHRPAIASIWSDFLEGAPYVPHAFVDDKDGSGQISIELLHDIPRTIALEMGECLYQMRAARDWMVYEAACLISGQNPPPLAWQLEFPIGQT